MHLWGHATDRPRRWKEPRAFAATDHTAQRARQGRGRRTIRRRVSEECAAWGRTAGSLIPHARAIRALMIAMIEAALRTGPVAAARGADRSAAGRRATGRRAIRMAAIARGTDREGAAAQPTRFLAKRCVHEVGAATHSNWTRTSHPWHKERRLARSVGASRRSPRVWRSKLQTLTSSATDVSVRDRTPAPKPKRPWTLTELWTRRRAHSSLQNRADAVSHKRPPPSSFFDQETGTGRPAREVQISTLLRGQRQLGYCGRNELRGAVVPALCTCVADLL